MRAIRLLSKRYFDVDVGPMLDASLVFLQSRVSRHKHHLETANGPASVIRAARVTVDYDAGDHATPAPRSLLAFWRSESFPTLY